MEVKDRRQIKRSEGLVTFKPSTTNEKIKYFKQKFGDGAKNNLFIDGQWTFTIRTTNSTDLHNFIGSLEQVRCKSLLIKGNVFSVELVKNIAIPNFSLMKELTLFWVNVNTMEFLAFIDSPYLINITLYMKNSYQTKSIDKMVCLPFTHFDLRCSGNLESLMTISRTKMSKRCERILLSGHDNVGMATFAKAEFEKTKKLQLQKYSDQQQAYEAVPQRPQVIEAILRKYTGFRRTKGDKTTTFFQWNW